MTMTLGSNPHRFGSLNFDHMSSYPSSQPHFSNPWAAPSSSGVGHQSSPHGSHGLYTGGSQNALGANPLSLESLTKHHPSQPQHVSRTSTGSTASLASYGSIPVTTPSSGSPHTHNLLSLNRLPPAVATTAPYGETGYTSAASPIHPTYTSASPASYESMARFAPAPMQPAFPPVAHSLSQEPDHHSARRYSQTGGGIAPDDRSRFADALEASQGMLSMSQDTPRNIYGPGPDASQAAKGRGSADSYGFPSTHSNSSSVSSSSGFGYYAPSSVSDYSTAGSDIESTAAAAASRTLPRPQGHLAALIPPPAPHSMMNQFSAKAAIATQKKHKCKVCDKRFTRPSSLQTHMYSHTGEKPFSCEVEGCGRQFSVVSNLRRHRKVHKGDTRSEAGSEDHDHHSD